MAHWLLCQSCGQWSKSAVPMSDDMSCPLCGSLFTSARELIKPFSEKEKEGEKTISGNALEVETDNQQEALDSLEKSERAEENENQQVNESIPAQAISEELEVESAGFKGNADSEESRDQVDMEETAPGEIIDVNDNAQADPDDSTIETGAIPPAIEQASTGPVGSEPLNGAPTRTTGNISDTTAGSAFREGRKTGSSGLKTRRFKNR